jgi:hypothetical protein
MAKHVIKCAVCGESFDTNEIQAVRYGVRRYAHYDCYPQGELVPIIESKRSKKEETKETKEKDPDLKALMDYINQLFGDKCNWAMTQKYIKKFKEEDNYSYSGILKSLIYFYEVKHNPIDKAKGSIGIVPFVYQDAYNYYYSVYMAQQNMQNGTVNKDNVVEKTIKIPKSKGIFKRLFKIGVDE